MRTPQTRQLPCGFTEDLLIAEALGENSYNLSQQVAAHFVTCYACRQLLDRYQRLRAHLSVMSSPQGEAQGLLVARRRLDARLTQKNRPRLQLKVWRSPVGDIRLGKTEKGVALVEFVRHNEATDSPARWRNDFTVENDGGEVAALIQKLDDYFSGKTHTLEWIVDDVLMRSDFQREVLRATAEVPYGTVVTYQGIADTIGQPKAVRAVAQALRHNPVPIHIPCHRVIGSDGALTGYAGNLVEIKQKILAVEGIPVVETSKGLAIPRARMYVGWRHDRAFCRPDCSCLKDQSAGDRAFIPSRARAEEMGYTACDVCRPDIHPLA
jgi:O-6-methylguanine DNA methyltransferase